VGGLYQKVYGARQAGVTRVVIPEENKDDLPAAVPGVTLVPVSTIEEVLDAVLSATGEADGEAEPPTDEPAAAAAAGGKGSS
jgi:ATP-dependent Lon protease